MSRALNLRPFRSLLIANRGEIACRIATTARTMGKRVIAVYSSADANALHVQSANAAIEIGSALPAESYLNIDAILAAARDSGAEAIHPGYGFLAENDRFAQAVLEAGLVWVGPPPDAMRAMSSKAGGKRLARQLSVPVLAGYDGDDQADATLRHQAHAIGFPLLIKASAGGGGRGMRLVHDAAAFDAALASARAEALAAFGDDTLILERALSDARHVEVQIFADAHGACVHLGERDCSVQRRHQKLIEESPAPNLSSATREAMCRHAVELARAIGYVGAGTMEFLLDADERYAFMEMNTRLQVEHPVTEARTGIDLVEWQLRVAAGEALPKAQHEITFSGYAIELRLCAEDAARDFTPQSGTLTRWSPPVYAQPFAHHAGLRLDSAIHAGAEISPYYDSMIAKLVAHAGTRDAAREQLAAALDTFVVFGVVTNQALLARVLRDATFAAGRMDTTYLARHRDRLAALPPLREAATVAAVLWCLDHARASGFGEWAHWSNALAHRAHLALRASDEVVRLQVERTARGFEVIAAPARARIPSAGASTQTPSSTSDDGPPILVEVLAFEREQATVRLAHSRVQRAVPYTRSDRTIALQWNGHAFDLSEHIDAGTAQRDGDTLDGRILAPMTGRVVAVHVAPGAEVAKAAPLLALSAMKMEHVLSAPADLLVSSMHVSIGDQVRPGQLLMEFVAR